MSRQIRLRPTSRTIARRLSSSYPGLKDGSQDWGVAVAQAWGISCVSSLRVAILERRWTELGNTVLERFKWCLKGEHPPNSIIRLNRHRNFLGIAPAVGKQKGQGEKKDSIRELCDKAREPAILTGIGFAKFLYFIGIWQTRFVFRNLANPILVRIAGSCLSLQ
jgi:hypothetical protein